MATIDCTLTTPEGLFYDLSSLSSNTDYIIKAYNQTYGLNICRSVVKELYKLPDASDVGGYIERLDGDFSIGSANASLSISPSSNDLIAVLANGSPCPSNPSSTASSIIHFICSPSTFTPTAPTLLTALPPGSPADQCTFIFEWSTHLACPTGKKVGGWGEVMMGDLAYVGVLVAFIAIAFFTYLIFHTAYNRFALGLRGRAQFPSLPTPTLPSLRLPAFKFPNLRSLFSRSPTSGPGFTSWRSQNGYNHVGAYDPDDDEEEGFAGRFSLEDEDGEGGEDARALAGDPSVWRDVRRPGVSGPLGGGVGKTGELVNL